MRNHRSHHHHGQQHCGIEPISRHKQPNRASHLQQASQVPEPLPASHLPEHGHHLSRPGQLRPAGSQKHADELRASLAESAMGAAYRSGEAAISAAVLKNDVAAMILRYVAKP